MTWMHCVEVTRTKKLRTKLPTFYRLACCHQVSPRRNDCPHNYAEEEQLNNPTYTCNCYRLGVSQSPTKRMVYMDIFYVALHNFFWTWLMFIHFHSFSWGFFFQRQTRLRESLLPTGRPGPTVFRESSALTKMLPAPPLVKLPKGSMKRRMIEAFH